MVYPPLFTLGIPIRFRKKLCSLDLSLMRIIMIESLFGNPKKKTFNKKEFFCWFLVVSILSNFFGYYSFLFLDVVNGKIFCMVIAEVLGVIYVILSNNYWLSYFYKKAVVLILTLTYIFFTAVMKI